MDFKVSMTVSEAQLGGMLAKFNKGQLADIKLEPIAQANGIAVPIKKPGGKKAPNPKLTGKPGSLVMLGDTCHRVKGDVSVAMVKQLEKMEATQGIGTVTRRMLCQAATQRGITKHPNEPVMAMLKAGHMVIVGED